MLRKITLDAEDGFVDFGIAGVEVNFDARRIHELINNRLLQAERDKWSTDKKLQLIAEQLQELGFPNVSHDTADLFWAGLKIRIIELDKKKEAWLASLASPDSTD